ncbi:uncharacterized protein EV420DRAFT_1690546 [Desarmillaria tabescens]|uniref:Uncharacterized protein n=1 Tax=Armillaria tabescens TaxID=1929756 RepID=A0AA39IZU8_ARMTA|nr:uncharacterized protein EV420DRAFT_1690546 [Desarmillaria tabescens]KAK0433493.1 hypothetical protein EV420DRAFT_1690546 [Desarmillaria tabescens]
MSSTAPLPIRERCVDAGSVFCQCSRFTPYRDESQWHTLDQSRCICGHGIHAHADYLSPVVHQCPATCCVAFVQKTPQTQECTCTALLVDHKAVVNLYRIAPAITNNWEPYVGTSQSIVPSYSMNASNPVIPISSPNTAGALLHIQPVSAQAENVGFVTHHLQGLAPDSITPNATFSNHPDAVYDTTPNAGVWTWSYT